LLLIIAVVLGILSVSAISHTNVVVEWSTASELDTAGFNLYRKDKPDGQATQVNTSLIPASVDPLTGGAYRYKDSQVEPGRTYYYELEEVEANGNTSRFGPIEVKAVRGGFAELVVSTILALVSLVSLGIIFLTKKNAPSRASSSSSLQKLKPQSDHDRFPELSDASHSVTLSVSGIGISLACNDGVLAEALRQRYKAFPLNEVNENKEIFQVWVRSEAPMHEEEGAPFNPQGGFQGNLWQLKTPGCQGFIDEGAGRGQLDLSTHNALEAVDYFVRACIALLAFRAGGVLFHAAGIVRLGQAYLFFGHSGSGKTTIARNSIDDLVLNDDLVVLLPHATGWTAHATPFWNPSQVQFTSQNAPVAGLYRLVQDTQVLLEPMSKAEALAELVSNTPVIPENVRRSAVLLERLQHLLEDVPAWRLHFLPDGSFWKAVSEKIEQP
jgi:hypothetical protein